MAPNPTDVRSMYAYSLHGRTPSGVVDYPRFFNELASKEAEARQALVGREMVAITAMMKLGNQWLIRFIAASEKIPPFFYNPDTGVEVHAELGGQVVASVSWMMVDPSSRFVVVERRRLRRGVAVGTMSRALTHMSGDLDIGPERVVFDLNPIFAKSFIHELDQYQRIRQASVVLSRPNLNWSDNASTLTKYAGESNADNVEVTMSANEEESLERDRGIVADIKKLIRKPIGPLRNLRIVGLRKNAAKETATSLQRLQEKRTFTFSAAKPVAEREAFCKAATALIADLVGGKD